MDKITKKQKAVQEYILDKMSSGMREGEMLPTVKELSETLGVSPMTVHKAVTQMTETGLLYKIQGKGTFVGKAGGQARNKLRLENGKKVIAFISPYIHDDIFMKDFTSGVLENINHNKFSLITKHVWIPKLKEEEVISETAGYVDGIILISNLESKARKVISSLLASYYPMVFLDHYPLDMQCNAVCTDDDEATLTAMKHLYECNHRKILHVSLGNGFSSTLSRQEVYTQFMEQHGLEPRIAELGAVRDFNIGVLDKFFFGARASWPTAIFALNDGIAMNIIRYLKSKGIKVPDDVSVMGFDDDIGSATFEIPLTTMALPKKQIGGKAVKLLQDMLEKRKEPSKYYIEAKLVERESVKILKESKLKEAI